MLFVLFIIWGMDGKFVSSCEPGLPGVMFQEEFWDWVWTR